MTHLDPQYSSESPVQENLEGIKKGFPENPVFASPQEKIAGGGLEQHILLICVHMVVIPYLGHGSHQGVCGCYSLCYIMVVAKIEGYPCTKIFEVSEKFDNAARHNNQPRLGEVIISQIFSFASCLLGFFFRPL